jgi:hypothetical protein
MPAALVTPGAPHLRTVVLGDHLERLPEVDRDGFVRSVAERLGEPVVDYVRLNSLARAPATDGRLGG